MKLAYSTGNDIVDEVSEMNFTGNVIPLTWFKTMIGDTGKPMLLAIDLLADIVYWYRPKEIRDEDTGDLIGFQKRFKADFLQRSYRQIEQRFGVTRKQARGAIDYLCSIGVIKKHLRNEMTSMGMPLHNNMYLELVPERLKELTYPQSDDDVPLREPRCALEGTRVVPSGAEGGAQKVTTCTENTTENSTRDYIPSIYSGLDGVEIMKAYEEIIKENIEYNELNMEIAKTLLENNGLEVTCAVDGQEAVELFEKSSPGYFGIIYMDIMMPRMNGMDAARAIRALNRHDARSIGIIAMSANSFAEDIIGSRLAGMNVHLTKPLDTDKMIDALRECLAGNEEISLYDEL